MNFIPFNSIYPNIYNSSWVAQNATVIGNVILGKESSLWHGVILRGDIIPIKIGEKSVIHDLTILKSNDFNLGKISIGDNVVIGPNCTIDSCEIENNSFI